MLLVCQLKKQSQRHNHKPLFNVDISVDESGIGSKSKGRKGKKAEAAALAAAEQIRKYGICSIPIKVANFFCAGKPFYRLPFTFTAAKFNKNCTSVLLRDISAVY